MTPPPSTRRRWRWLVPAVLATATVVGLVVWLAARDRGTTTTPAASASGLATRTIEAGAVTVEIQPVQVDAAGAVFKISFDTHSVNLGTDVAATSRLVVAGADWPVIGWSGAGPGGHHREGELTFAAGGPATGAMTLTLDGLPGPVSASWDVAG